MKPTDIDDVYWVYAFAPDDKVKSTDRSGKWMLFNSRSNHDESWEKVRVGTMAGSLGCQAKAATSKGNPNAGGSTSLLICVYTSDSEDVEDVTRVLARLRELGFIGRLSYKTDAETLNGVYGKGASLYVAQPGLSVFDRRR
jgi:hypothetical protein